MSESAPPLYRDPDAPVDERVRDLLSRMTVDEKVAQLGSAWLQLDPESGEFAPFQSGFGDAPVPDRLLELGLGQVTRPFGSRPVEPTAGARALAALQRSQSEGTRLGVPAIAHEECLTGFMAQGATQFPTPLCYGATWDPELIRRVGDAIRRQMRAAGVHQGLAPVADVVRDPRWGRVEECVGEDPYLVGRIVTAYVQGLQGDDWKTGVIATLKHFAGYSGSEGGRNTAPTHVGPRELADVHLLPFEMAVKLGRARSVMNSYQANDGVPSGANRALLTGWLRERWGFEGFVVADYFSVRLLERVHHVAGDPAEAAAAALSAGLDVELPNADCFEAGLPEALERGLISLDDLDRALERVLRAKVELGLLDGAPPEPEALELERPEDRALARRVAERAITLLANDGALPLSAEVGRIAVVGPNADDPMALFGNYSFQNHVASHFPDAPLPSQAPSVLDALRDRLGEERVVFARGCEVMSDDRSDIAAAVAAAEGADAVIAVVGDKAGHFRRGSVGEGTDTDDLSLPGAQPALLGALFDTGVPVVVVLVNGRPFALGDVAERAAAILEAWFPGQDGAAAIADALFGDLNPGGRTTVTFSRSAGAQPRTYDHQPSAPGFPPHPSFAPVFPFGHGLSYTRFEYADLELAADEVPVDGAIELAFTLRNTGDRTGDEVVQLYVRDEVASVARPVLELKGFERVHLAAGAAARVRFVLPVDMLSFTGLEGARIVEPGSVALKVGASSADVRLEARVQLTGAVREVGEDRALTSNVRVEPASGA